MNKNVPKVVTEVKHNALKRFWLWLSKFLHSKKDCCAVSKLALQVHEGEGTIFSLLRSEFKLLQCWRILVTCVILYLVFSHRY